MECAKNLAAARDLRERWLKLVEGSSPRVVLADGEDVRVMDAVIHLHAETALAISVIGRRELVEPILVSSGIDLGGRVSVVDPSEVKGDEALIEELRRACSRRQHEPVDFRSLARDPLYAGALMVRTGEAQACVGGSSRPTPDVIRAAMRVIGLKPGIDTLSSCFLMVLANGHTVAYGDCVVLPEPTAEQLADVAVASAHTYEQLTGKGAVVALLSFSTKGSAGHESAARVRRAVEILREKAPDLEVDGELQFDAAYVQDVARLKAPDSRVAGRANVFIFPNLDAGNIGYKITQRVGNALALGPVLQGLSAPMNDVSRGCVAEDVTAAAIMSAVQAIAYRKRTTSPAAVRHRTEAAF